MARLNKKIKPTEFTHEGMPAKNINAEQALRRSVMSCMLWENEFYEDGQEISKRISELAAAVPPAKLASIAVEARKVQNLRHVPLLLLSVLCKTGSGSRLVSDTIFEVVSRADELTELLAIYWRDGKKPLSAQLKKGLARAFAKFDSYQLAKYNRDNAIKLRDVLFLTHAKPTDEALYKNLAEKTLQSPDTWEVALSGGADKKETFTRLLQEGKLGYFALLRNLRNMDQAGVDDALVRDVILARKSGAEKILPFRFIAAARAVPKHEKYLDQSLMKNLEAMPPLKGRTIVLVDISPSMNDKLSAKSDLTRMDAAAALSGIVSSDELRVFVFANVTAEVPARRGMAGIDAVTKAPIERNGTLLGKAIREINCIPHDRLIVITDEQSQDAISDPVAKQAYMINVASNKNGIGYGRWTHIDGFSENVLRFITEFEKAE